MKKNELMEKIAFRYDIDIIKKIYSAYLIQVMCRDIRDVDTKIRGEIQKYIIEFIDKCVEKEYLNNDNSKDFMTRLVDTTSNFGKIEANGAIYGDVKRDSIMRFAYSNNYFITHMKHIVFHEAAHAVTSLYNQSYGVLKEEKLNESSKKQNSDKLHISFKATTRNVDIINGFFQKFLNEVAAEAMACDLDDEYREKVKVWWHLDIYSDWIIPYNRNYQELGYEFLKTIYNEQDERKVFKLFILDLLEKNKNKSFFKNVMDIYKEKNEFDWKNDLHEISNILVGCLDGKCLKQDEIDYVRKIIGKYQNIFIPKR